MRDDTRFYINGEWVEPAVPKTLDVINPANEEVCGKISLGAAAALVPDAVAREAPTALDLLAQDGRPDGVTVTALDDVVAVHRALESGRAPAKTVLRIAPL